MSWADAGYAQAAYGESGGVPTITVTGGLATEADSALTGSVKVGARLTGGLPAETDSALGGSLTIGIILTVGLATESDSGLAGAVVQGTFLPGGLPTEADSALAGSITVGAFVAGGLATETDTALAAVFATITLGQAQETDSTFAGAVIDGDVHTLGLVVEHDNAFAGTISVGYAFVDTTNRAGGLTISGTGVLTWEPNPAPIPDVMLAAFQVDKAASFPTPTVVNGRPTVDATWTSAPRPRHRIVVGGKDITFFRGVPTPPLDYDLLSPLLYGPGTLQLPQVFAAFEEPGVGELHWLHDDARVVQQRVDDEGNVVSTDYIGFVVAYDPDGRNMSVQLGGEVSGQAALMERPVPLWKRRKDAGRFAWNLLFSAGVGMKPFLGPKTDIEVTEFGGTTVYDCINQLCAMAVKKSGEQFTIMPDSNGDYRMQLKDTTTIHATAYIDDANLRAQLRRDLAEEPNRIFGTGVTPDGMRVVGGVYPGLLRTEKQPYPFHDNRNFGPGTTDADTDTGDGISVLITRLQPFGYLDRRDVPGGYDDDVADAIEALQDDANLPQTGHMTPATWKALWDLDVTGYSLGWSHIAPMAARKEVRPWIRSASGAIIGKNPDYNRRVLKRDRTVDFGTGFKRSQMRQWARDEVRDRSDNYVGTLNFETGALVAGDHTPGDPVTVMPARDLRPGMNIKVPHFAGGITVHVSGVSVRGGKVSATVDTRARDTMQVWQVIARNRESRRNLSRAWMRDHRASSNVKDQIGEWSEIGGLVDAPVPIRGNSWGVFQCVAGESGSIAELVLQTNPNAEFAVAIFGRPISAKTLNHAVGNPLTAAGRTNWDNEAVRNRLDRNHLLLYAAGDKDSPCGYWPKQKILVTPFVHQKAANQKDIDDINANAASESRALTDSEVKQIADLNDQNADLDQKIAHANSIPLTGVFKDAAGFGFQTFGRPPVLYVAVYADRNTHIQAGRIFKPQQDPA